MRKTLTWRRVAAATCLDRGMDLVDDPMVEPDGREGQYEDRMKRCSVGSSSCVIGVRADDEGRVAAHFGDREVELPSSWPTPGSARRGAPARRALAQEANIGGVGASGSR